MAQYFQVLSQGDKNMSDGMTKLYRTNVENQNVQYVITPENQQQQLPGQQIVVATDQLMVIENPSQPVIVDQPTNALQNQQFVIQEGVPASTGIHPQTQQDQVYYTTTKYDRDQTIVVDDFHQQSSPVVINQLQQTRNQSSNGTPKDVTTSQLQPTQSIQIQQSRTIIQSSLGTIKHNIVQQKMILHRSVTHNSSGITITSPSPAATQRNTDVPPLHYHQPQPKTTQDAKCINDEEEVSLLDGSVVPVSDYKEMVANKKQSANNTTDSTASVIDEMDMKQVHSKRMENRPSNIRQTSIRSVRSRRSISTRTNVITHNIQLSQSQENVELKSQVHRRFIQQQQLKMVQQQQRTLLPQTEFDQHDQQLLQQQQQQQQQQVVVSQQQSPVPQQLQQQQPSALQQLQQQSPAPEQPASQQHAPQQSAPQQPAPQQPAPQQPALQQPAPQQLAFEQPAPQQQLEKQSPTRQPLQERDLSPEPYVQRQFIIQPPSMHQSPQHDLPPSIVSGKIKHIIETSPKNDEYPDSIRMLVLMDTGEQRLITFTLPSEVCTIQEILDQVGVHFKSDTKIDCQETCFPGINYLVTVGFHTKDYISQDEPSEEDVSSKAIGNSSSTEHISSSSERLIESETSQYISGIVAICNHCGYSSENLSKCLRCKHMLKNEVKTTQALSKDLEGVGVLKDKKITLNLKNRDAIRTTDFNNKKRAKTKMDSEPDVLTLSSDEEEGSDINNLSETEQLLKRFNNSSTTLSAIRKEPTILELQRRSMLEKNSDGTVKEVEEDISDHDDVDTTIKCRIVRIGSYKFTPKSDVIVKATNIILKVPSIQDSNEIKTIIIERKHIAKVLVHFQKEFPVIFFYLTAIFGDIVRDELGMERGDDPFFDPLSDNESLKRITLIPEYVDTEIIRSLQAIYTKSARIDDLTIKEANDIFMKTCPKEITKIVETTTSTSTTSYVPGVRQLLIYPPGKGGLPINTEDYMCLTQDQFLNDVIIDFYLKYLVLQLSVERQAKIHVFSTFFYKRLTTKPAKATKKINPAELDPNLTHAQRRHTRVKKWTKNVNLFEKDFIIVPINENCHWYLAIICFPSLDGAYTMDGKPVVMEEKRKDCKTITLGNVTITNVKKERVKPILCDDIESDRDEAEGDESELDSDSANESDDAEGIKQETNTAYVPIKQPCILIFDSLPGASRARVVATLRDYLTCEYKAKLGIDKVFNKENIKGNCPKVPQQTNFTDCGLYLLQYVEHFLNHPIPNYEIPIKHIRRWFAEYTVTKKREDIALLIKDLMVKYNIDISSVPVLALPTLNGKPVDNFEDDEEGMNDFDEDDEEEEEDELHHDASSDCANTSIETQADLDGHSDLEGFESSPSNIILQEELLPEITLIPKPSSAKKGDGLLTETVSNEQELKPVISEHDQLRSKQTLSYLKSKRISKHKNSESIDPKKFKSSYD